MSIVEGSLCVSGHLLLLLLLLYLFCLFFLPFLPLQTALVSISPAPGPRKGPSSARFLRQNRVFLMSVLYHLCALRFIYSRYDALLSDVSYFTSACTTRAACRLDEPFLASSICFPFLVCLVCLVVLVVLVLAPPSPLHLHSISASSPLPLRARARRQALGARL